MIALDGAGGWPRLVGDAGPMHTPIAAKVLETIHELQCRDRAPNAGSIARALAVRPTQVGEALLHLERLGLVDASRARLTMRGLALAAAFARDTARHAVSCAA